MVIQNSFLQDPDRVENVPSPTGTRTIPERQPDPHHECVYCGAWFKAEKDLLAHERSGVRCER